MKTRLGGVFFLFLVAVLGYMFIYTPLHEASNGARSISTSMKGVALLPLCLLMGLGMLVGGPRFIEATYRGEAAAAQGGSKASLLGWILIISGLVAGFGCYWWLQNYLKTLGYQ